MTGLLGSFSPVRILAAKEFHDRLRNRWVMAVALTFTVLALVIAYFGTAQQGTVGFHSIELTIASLVSLVIYLVPLIALMLGFDAIVGERERGSLGLLLSMPVSRTQVLVGKYLGLAAALTASTVIGFGLVAFVLAADLDLSALAHYLVFMASSVLLGLAFLSIAVMISVFATSRAGASGVTIGLWLFFVLIFDLLMLGGLVAGGGLGGDVVPYLLLLNPADVFRVLNIVSLDEVRTLNGLATVFPEALASPALLVAMMGAWMAVPLAIAAWRFRR
jgi:Cu-processing system permease protein